MTKEKRLKNITIIAKRIAEFRTDSEHSNIKEVVVEGAKEDGCAEGRIRLEGIEYPDEIVW